MTMKSPGWYLGLRPPAALVMMMFLMPTTPAMRIGNETFRVLILPPMTHVDPRSASKVAEFERAGGVVLRVKGREHKPFMDHLIHLAVHGFLHLAGYDHAAHDQAAAMERLEAAILARLGVPDPYLARGAA